MFSFKKILEEIIPFIRTLFLKKFSTFMAFTFNTNLKLKGEKSIFPEYLMGVFLISDFLDSKWMLSSKII